MEPTAKEPTITDLASLVGKYDASTLPLQLMAKPALSWSEFWQELLNIPDSTANQVARQPDGPPFFLIGRRRFIRTEDARAWIDRVADSRRYVPRVNVKGKS
ncbi:hypothetical protein MRB56_14165 [Halomonas cupida]|uniref:hypothetical protein n=1 Tax=Halomonas cupida TaxID=44933 RepID=UPI0039B654C9